jgi:hypothetical protein
MPSRVERRSEREPGQGRLLRATLSPLRAHGYIDSQRKFSARRSTSGAIECHRDSGTRRTARVVRTPSDPYTGRSTPFSQRLVILPGRGPRVRRTAPFAMAYEHAKAADADDYRRGGTRQGGRVSEISREERATTYASLSSWLGSCLDRCWARQATWRGLTSRNFPCRQRPSDRKLHDPGQAPRAAVAAEAIAT